MMCVEPRFGSRNQPPEEVADLRNKLNYPQQASVKRKFDHGPASSSAKKSKETGPPVQLALRLPKEMPQLAFPWFCWCQSFPDVARAESLCLMPCSPGPVALSDAAETKAEAGAFVSSQHLATEGWDWDPSVQCFRVSKSERVASLPTTRLTLMVGIPSSPSPNHCTVRAGHIN